ncbi:alpha/beta hydrolase domain-containing protein [Cnuibacter physcomitrellae]|uniref:alpha/beta hydrolase domain-containing protein n=1 Tax=Cnuibacter physcomitrellae TaxID=1619308 RepID=UPI002175FB52|nr:alpha/beta hydrolase domain-containing protein [Cnuibacter physcomitrellae]MCS5498354.1 alpha/beta hydrolase domain-containing protein [Cnuibacter physcomitrellae]
MTSRQISTRPRRRGRFALTAAVAVATAAGFAVVPLSAAGAATVGTKAVAAAVTASTLTRVESPGTALSAAAVDLAAYGYTESEFYSEGTADRYRGATASATSDATVIDGGWDYRTRVLVRAPEPSRFNGTLLVEWTNVTIGLDADFVFAEAHASLLRDGYAIAVVSAQKVGVDRLTTWSPDRYGALSVDADNVDPVGGGNVDPCGTAPCAGDPLSWDVFTQTAAALKANLGDDPALPGLTVQNVIATGQSQSASRLTAYYNAIQPIQGFFDGFVFWDRATAPLRSDVGVPAISVDSEGLSNVYPPFPDSASTRTWEVAGSTHGSLYAADYVDAMFDRDGGLLGPDGQPESFSAWVEPSCEVVPAFSTVPAGLVVAAAIHAVKDWIETGTPAAPSLFFDRLDDGTIERDASGRIEGGVRLAEFVVPTAEISAFNGTAFPCSVSGSHRYYSDAEMLALYGTHDSYVAQVRQVTDAAAEAGYLLPADAVATVATAEASTVAVSPTAPVPPSSTPSASATPTAAAGAGSSLAATGLDTAPWMIGGMTLAGLGAALALIVASRRRGRPAGRR